MGASGSEGSRSGRPGRGRARWVPMSGVLVGAGPGPARHTGGPVGPPAGVPVVQTGSGGLGREAFRSCAAVRTERQGQSTRVTGV